MAAAMQRIDPRGVVGSASPEVPPRPCGHDCGERRPVILLAAIGVRPVLAGGRSGHTRRLTSRVGIPCQPSSSGVLVVPSQRPQLPVITHRRPLGQGGVARKWCQVGRLNSNPLLAGASSERGAPLGMSPRNAARASSSSRCSSAPRPLRHRGRSHPVASLPRGDSIWCELRQAQLRLATSGGRRKSVSRCGDDSPIECPTHVVASPLQAVARSGRGALRHPSRIVECGRGRWNSPPPAHYAVCCRRSGQAGGSDEGPRPRGRIPSDEVPRAWMSQDRLA